MGKQAKLRKERNKTIHVRNFRNVHGMTPEQMHVEALAQKCKCGLDASSRAISYAPVLDLANHAPHMLEKIMVENGGQVPIVEFTYGKFVKIGEVYACNLCRPMMEKEAAKGPSWVLVHIDRGPGPMSTSVQVPGGS